MNRTIYVGLGVLAAIVVAAFVFTQTMSKSPESDVIRQTQATPTSTQSALVMTEEIVIAGDEYSFSPANVTLKKGTTYRLTFKNTGNAPHNYVSDELGVSTATIKGGEAVTAEVTPQKTGTFEVYCSVGNHEDLGMVGKI
ncbi:MAG: cupredoxin domain-containing protein, partial [Patescibacteria group bacterium]